MVLTLALLLATVPQVQPEVSSAAAAFVVFQKNCAGCHGDTGFAKGYLLLDRSAMVKAGKVTPGNAAESILYKRISGAIEPIMPGRRPEASGKRHQRHQAMDRRRGTRLENLAF